MRTSAVTPTTARATGIQGASAANVVMPLRKLICPGTSMRLRLVDFTGLAVPNDRVDLLRRA